MVVLCAPSSYFNSIKVRLKRARSWWRRVLRSYFNSIKVRLKLQHFGGNKAILQFQFHKGTIKTPEARLMFRSVPVFQFHKGTIKTFLCLVLTCALPNFNSIKVRLKPSFRDTNGLFAQFQFHKGTIKTGQRICITIYHNYFNSIKVRLKLINPSQYQNPKEISIP